MMTFKVTDKGSKIACTRCRAEIPTRVAVCPKCGACQGCD